MKKKQTVGLVIAVVLFIVTGAASVLTNTVSKNILSKEIGKIGRASCRERV